MLTILAMVRVGPWTLTSVEREDELTRCERCGKAILEVWTCQMDAGHDLTELGGKAKWRIGSDCGPELMRVSGEVWTNKTKVVTRRLRLAKRVDKLLEKAGATGYSLPDRVAGSRQDLLDGTLDDRSMKHLGGMMTGHERALGLRKA